MGNKITEILEPESGPSAPKKPLQAVQQPAATITSSADPNFFIKPQKDHRESDAKEIPIIYQFSNCSVNIH